MDYFLVRFRLMPITVCSAPLGLPFVLILGGNFMSLITKKEAK